MSDKIKVIIGGTDMSPFVEQETYSVERIWNEASSFSALNGAEIKKYSGYYYAISINFEDLPDSLMSALASVVNSDKYTVEFTNPVGTETSLEFNRAAEMKGTASCRTDEGLFWNTSISIKSIFCPLSGDSL